MTIEIIPAKQAWATQRSNPEGRWPTRETPERLSPIASPKARPSFCLKPEDKVFCIGSCFAREIEIALRNLEFDVLSIVKDLPQSPKRTVPDRNMYNKYNLAAILNELRWALDPAAQDGREAMISVGQGHVLDFQLAGDHYADELEFAEAMRKAINANFRLIKNADVVVITLGMSEAWFDKTSGLYLNQSPHKALVDLFPERFELHVLDYEDSLRLLEETYALLKAHLKAGFRLLVTVSPVPLYATFRDQDVLNANTYSKAVLRVAAERFCSGKENVDYFPSYELVTLSNPQATWVAWDFRHVDKSFIEFIMASALEQYAPDGPGVREAAVIARATALYRSDYHTEALATLKPLLSVSRGLSNPRALILAQAIRMHWTGLPKDWVLRTLNDLRPGNLRDTWRGILTSLRGKLRHGDDPRAIGYVDQWDGHHLGGWCLRKDKRSGANIRVEIEGQAPFEVKPGLSRRDVVEVYGEDSEHSGFSIPLDLGSRQEVRVRVWEVKSGRELHNSPFLATRRPEV